MRKVLMSSVGIIGKPLTFLLELLIFRFEICKEIIVKGLHKEPFRFQSFSMAVYCFPEPDDPQQVYLLGNHLFLEHPHYVYRVFGK